jgi:hypothetical protein
MRTLKYPDQQAQAAAELEAWAGVGKKKRKSAGPDPEKSRKELAGMMLAGDYSKATATHLVALYEWCHEQIYGVRPAELSTRAAWKQVSFAASKLMKEQFKGDAVAVIDFIRWTWRREKGREDARRAGRNAHIGRVGWRLQFAMRYLVTDYRVETVRSGG